MLNKPIQDYVLPSGQKDWNSFKDLPLMDINRQIAIMRNPYQHNKDDKIRWKFSIIGEFTESSSYSNLMNHPQQDISMFWKKI